MPKYSVGQNVTYVPVGGQNNQSSSTTGTIKQVVTDSNSQIGGVTVHQASASRPCYEIENNETKKTSAIYEDNISGKA